jgi:hypothetical protein
MFENVDVARPPFIHSLYFRVTIFFEESHDSPKHSTGECIVSRATTPIKYDIKQLQNNT